MKRKSQFSSTCCVGETWTVEYALLAKAKGGLSMRARSAPGGKETNERLRDANAPGGSMTSSSCGCEGRGQLGVTRAMSIIEDDFGGLWIS